jgi:hypothetical protein
LYFLAIRKFLKGWAGMLLLAVGSSVYAEGFIKPLVIAVEDPILDEFDQTLEGSGLAPGDFVQILEADTSVDPNGIIHPPNPDGTPDLRNPAFYETTAAIGQLTPLNMAQPGFFAKAINRKQGTIFNGRKIFIRVFNASAISASSFYADSAEILTVNNNLDLIYTIGKTDQPIDSTDADGDGLNNSWEQSYGTDLNNTDTDGDGVTDGIEVAEGRDPLVPDNYLMITAMALFGGDLAITWSSLPGETYHLEEKRMKPSLLGPYKLLSPTIDSEGYETTYTIVKGLLTLDQGCLIRVVSMENSKHTKY